MKFSPLERVGGCLRILDQTRLPNEVLSLELRDYRDIVKAIKSLQVRGAPAIGIAAAYGLAVAAEQSGGTDLEYLRRVANEFKAVRPTAVNLMAAVDRVMEKVEANFPSSLEGADFLWAEAEAIHEDDRRMCLAIGRHGSELIADGDSILTHCNTGALATGGIGTALGVIYTCRRQGKKNHVYVDETRPLLQGARLSAWELMQEGITPTLICDSTAGMLMRLGKVDHVIVGADRIARNGDLANKIGTYPLALLAREHHIPFYVAAPTSTFDNEITSGADILIEERSPLEVTEGFGARTAPDGIDVFSPAFDITPGELVSFYIVDTGLKPGGRDRHQSL